MQQSGNAQLVESLTHEINAKGIEIAALRLRIKDLEREQDSLLRKHAELTIPPVAKPYDYAHRRSISQQVVVNLAEKREARLIKAAKGDAVVKSILDELLYGKDE